MSRDEKSRSPAGECVTRAVNVTLRSGLRRVAGPLTAAALCGSLVGAAMVWSKLEYGSATALLQLANGKRVYANTTHRELGPLDLGDIKEVSFLLTNLHDEPVLIMGAVTNCGCIVAEEMPLELPARSTRAITFRISPFRGDDDRRFSYWMDLKMNVPNPQIRLKVSGELSGTVSEAPCSDCVSAWELPVCEEMPK